MTYCTSCIQNTKMCSCSLQLYHTHTHNNGLDKAGLQFFDVCVPVGTQEIIFESPTLMLSANLKYA